MKGFWALSGHRPHRESGLLFTLAAGAGIFFAAIRLRARVAARAQVCLPIEMLDKV